MSRALASLLIFTSLLLSHTASPYAVIHPPDRMELCFEFLDTRRVHSDELALRILHGEKASQIPLDISPTKYMFDHIQLERFGIAKSDLPEGSIVINKPAAFYDEYRGIIWGTASVIIVLMTVVAILAANTLRRRRAEKALRLTTVLVGPR